MGWSYGLYNGDLAAEMERQLTWETPDRKQRRLGHACVAMREVYYAVEVMDKATGECRIQGGVILIRFVRSDGVTELGLKGIGPDSGFCRCPKRILALFKGNVDASTQAWLDAIAQRNASQPQPPRLATGDTFVIPKGVRFTSGFVGYLFRKVERHRFRCVEGGFGAKLPNWVLAGAVPTPIPPMPADAYARFKTGTLQHCGEVLRVDTTEGPQFYAYDEDAWEQQRDQYRLGQQRPSSPVVLSARAPVPREQLPLL